MKTKWLVLAAAVTLLFLYTARENFEDTATIRGPPYGNTPTAARQIINIMPPTMLTSIKRQAGVTSDPLTDTDAVKIVYGNATNSSPIAQLMSDFYWMVYKPATATISLTQVNNFLELQIHPWVKEPGNRADLRQFLTTYFIRGQNGAAQSGYLESLNTVWGQMQVKAANTPAAPAAPAAAPKETAAAPVTSTLAYVAIGISAVALVAVVITLFLPQRNVL